MRFQPPHTKRNGGKLIFQKLFFFFLLKILDEYDGKYLSSKKKGCFCCCVLSYSSFVDQEVAGLT